jgi:ABC-2 type transport system ATP-binding protein
MGGAKTLIEAGRALDDKGIALDDLGIRRPSLDDVFLALTGHDTDSNADRIDNASGDGRTDD